MNAPASERAVQARINRKLKGGSVIKKCRRGKGWTYHDLGDYYEIDRMTSSVIATHIDLEEYARELGCLADYESMEVAE